MNLKTATVAIALLALTGCNMFQSKEEQCLQSTRLEFKDPGSLQVVQNLGSRGQPASTGEEFFWLRYKGKNSYGAYLSKNMACEKREGKWVRDRTRELLAVMKATVDEMRAGNDAMEACKTRECFESLQPAYGHLSPEELARRAQEEAEKKAEALVFDSPDNL